MAYEGAGAYLSSSGDFPRSLVPAAFRKDSKFSHRHFGRIKDDQLMPKTAVSMAPASYEKRVFSAAGKVFLCRSLCPNVRYSVVFPIATSS